MKPVLFLVGVFGVVMLANAQTVAPQLTARAWTFKTNPTNGTTQMRGSVEIRFGEVKVNADEADVNNDTGLVDLRGNVRLSLPPSAFRH